MPTYESYVTNTKKAGVARRGLNSGGKKARGTSYASPPKRKAAKNQRAARGQAAAVGRGSRMQPLQTAWDNFLRIHGMNRIPLNRSFPGIKVLVVARVKDGGVAGPPHQDELDGSKADLAELVALARKISRDPDATATQARQAAKYATELADIKSRVGRVTINPKGKRNMKLRWEGSRGDYSAGTREEGYRISKTVLDIDGDGNPRACWQVWHKKPRYGAKVKATAIGPAVSLAAAKALAQAHSKTRNTNPRSKARKMAKKAAKRNYPRKGSQRSGGYVKGIAVGSTARMVKSKGLVKAHAVKGAMRLGVSNETANRLYDAGKLTPSGHPKKGARGIPKGMKDASKKKKAPAKKPAKRKKAKKRTKAVAKRKTTKPAKRKKTKRAPPTPRKRGSARPIKVKRRGSAPTRGCKRAKPGAQSVASAARRVQAGEAGMSGTPLAYERWCRNFSNVEKYSEADLEEFT